MPIATGQLYEIKDFQEWSGRQVLNVYWYLNRIMTSTTAQEVADAFIADVQPDILAIQSSNVTHTTLEVTDVLSLTDFVTVPQVGVTGSRTGSDDMPRYVSVPFRLVRTTKETRNGRKSYAGLDEGAFNGTDYLGPYVTLLDTLAVTLAALLDTVTVPDLDAVIIRRPTPPDTDYIYNLISSTLYGRPSTQNSRKRKNIT